MTWLTWRLQRAELVLLTGLLMLLSILLVLTRDDAVRAATPLPDSECRMFSLGGQALCFERTGRLYQLVSGVLPWLNFLPLIAGLLIALPIVAELDSGAYRLAWTQSVTRARWTQLKFGLLIGSGALFAAVFAAVFQWWSSPGDPTFGRLGRDDYDFRGVVPVGHMLFAIGLLLAIGAVLRRPVPTIAIAGAIYVGVRLPFILWVRSRLVTPLTERSSDLESVTGPGVWQLSWWWENAAGDRIGEQQFFELCPPAGGPDALQACIDRNGLAQAMSYHPDSHYWPIQLIETAIFAGVGLMLIGFAAWWIMRRVE
ncbi:MAG: hypothetical protein IT336_11175 [Thermomicrobiales bacterium]|nr:hypothetical protein [Thermomicrobiales bacterium]